MASMLVAGSSLMRVVASTSLWLAASFSLSFLLPLLFIDHFFLKELFVFFCREADRRRKEGRKDGRIKGGGWTDEEREGRMGGNERYTIC